MEAAVQFTCGRLDEAKGAADSLHRFILGADERPVELDAPAIAELGDAVAQGLFAQGVFPHTPEELLTALDGAAPELATQRTFVVGEGTQFPAETPGSGLRAFLVTRGEGPDGPDIFISTSAPDAGFLEVMAWDLARQGFNYYQTRTPEDPWVFAGNSADALRSPSAGVGPFESHPSGHLVMKELRFPWVHWHSSAATVRADAVSPELVNHAWFTARDGAQDLEVGAVMPAIRRWTRARLQMAIGADGTVADPRQIMRSFVTTPTVNLISSRTQIGPVLNGAVETFDVPHAFFIDSECLHEILGLPAPGPEQFTLASALYRDVLTARNVTIRQKGQALLAPPQDTHFAFVVPERAFEDIEMVRVAVEIGLVSRRLAACLLMVDFSNPVFSERRAALLERFPQTATLTDGQSSFSEDCANAILGSEAASTDGTPEAEFAQLWSVGEEWPARFSPMLTDYFAAVAVELGTADGADRVFRLAESRRGQVRTMPIGAETELLFALPEPRLDEPLRMLPTAAIVTA